MGTPTLRATPYRQISDNQNFFILKFCTNNISDTLPDCHYQIYAKFGMNE